MTLIASMLSNRIRELRIEKAMTLERLSELTDLSVSYLSRLESGKRNLNTKSLVSIAAALRVKPADLIDTATAWLEVDIGAVISENQEIVPLASDRPNTVNVPSALGLVETILVRGATLYPRYNDGDVLTYNPDERDLSKVIGRECVVCLADKTLLLRVVNRGAMPDRYLLTSFNLPPIHDAKILWSAPIGWVSRAS